MKKIIASILIIILSFGITACDLLKKEDPAVAEYKKVAQEFIASGDYETAAKILDEGIRATNDDSLKALYYEVSTKQSTTTTKTQAESATQETTTTTPPANDEAKKQEARTNFQNKAAAIESYTKTHLDTAMTQSDMNIESGIVGEKWDDLLNEVYQYLKATMPTAQFNALKADEKAWIQRKENAVKNAGAQFAGGSAEILEKNMTYIEYTKERCYYLINLI